MNAKILKTLVYYDGPQVLLLEGRSKMTVVAVAVERHGMEYAFFGCEVYKHNWKKYLAGKADLYFLFSQSPNKNYYFFDLSKTHDSRVHMLKAARDEYLNPELWPERGFFSTCHSDMVSDDATVTKLQTFNIDGTWETTDFSSFYSKISDVYGIFYALKVLREKLDLVDVRNLQLSIKTKLWQGGGSYSSFYKGLSDVLKEMNPLRVNKIRYASPGQIELRGDDVVFDKVLGAFELRFEAIDAAHEAYTYINKVLAKEKLKREDPSAKFSSNALEEAVKARSDKIMVYLEIKDFDEFFNACDRNVLIYAKLVLSIYRRFKGIYDFMAEGRVAASQ